MLLTPITINRRDQFIGYEAKKKTESFPHSLLSLSYCILIVQSFIKPANTVQWSVYLLVQIKENNSVIRHSFPQSDINCNNRCRCATSARTCRSFWWEIRRTCATISRRCENCQRWSRSPSDPSRAAPWPIRSAPTPTWSAPPRPRM